MAIFGITSCSSFITHSLRISVFVNANVMCLGHDTVKLDLILITAWRLRTFQHVCLYLHVGMRNCPSVVMRCSFLTFYIKEYHSKVLVKFTFLALFYMDVPLFRIGRCLSPESILNSGALVAQVVIFATRWGDSGSTQNLAFNLEHIHHRRTLPAPLTGLVYDL